MDELLTFGAWLKQRRKTLDLTQQNLADLAHCSIVSIRKIESGDLTPSKQLAEALSMALKIDAVDQATFITFARSRHEARSADSFTTRSAAAARAVPAPGGPLSVSNRALRRKRSLAALISHSRPMMIDGEAGTR